MEPLRALIAAAEQLGSVPLTMRMEEKGMPQLIFFAVIGVVAYFGYRSFIKEAERVTAKARRAEREIRNGSQGTLVKDPKTGEYHVNKE